MPAITPNEATVKQKDSFPEEVLEVWNHLIIKNLDHNAAKILQDEAVTALTEALKVTRQAVFDNKWLNIEECYRSAGWHVKYNKPIYYGGDNFDPYYEFWKKV